MPNQIENIKSKGKEGIIRDAILIIEQKQPNLPLNQEDYEITVWANSREVLVNFRRLIRYARLGQHLVYDFSINVGNNTISPFDDWFYKGNFFIPTKDEKQVIQYLQDLLNLPCQGMETTISEDAAYYIVHCTSKTAFGIHHISKKTGERLAPLEGTFAVMPEDPLPGVPASEEQDPLIKIWD